MVEAGPCKDDCLALILSGGGARAAYQVGVMTALAELTPPGTPNPFPIICGTSAGAINALALATHAGNLHQAVDSMLEVWSEFRSHHVMRTDWPGLLGQAWRWSRTNLLGRTSELTTAMLDNGPLRELLESRMRFGCIEEALQAGQLRAISVSAFDYQASQSVYFYQGRGRITPWRRHRRIGVQTRLGLDHLMASTAIPLLFPPVLLNRTWYGDGAVRQQSPLSPALHLGANKVLVIGVTHHTSEIPVAGQPGPILKTPPPPSLAQLGGHLLHSTFIDSLESDLEQLERMNRLAAYQPFAMRTGANGIRHVDVLVISPSEPVDRIAARHRDALPAGLRLFLRGSGATRSSGSDLLSYLLFEAEYCNELIALGRRDALARADDLRRFLDIPVTA
ncbi:patatin-like phospholipase family protein [Pseudomonas sp. MYb185]|uniref:patatin-like phospholipase family protein n=1 Tax=Pseudomonas sp. MYb185 TaxID=1848729 RepID=UPI000CFDD163|nr:patatin-like phospholipase family protein [Pseudomonas sp. MYb185]PRB80479.1 Patatin [Pseudomonas sp. MYb185]